MSIPKGIQGEEVSIRAYKTPSRIPFGQMQTPFNRKQFKQGDAQLCWCY